jgi:hypothetical protein
MNWNQQDNKAYRGPIDRAFVSLTEPYEVTYFVDEYLSSRNYAVNDQTRQNIGGRLKRCALRAPIKRDELARWLDQDIGP